MFTYDENGILQVVLNNWLNSPRPKHMNKLNYYNFYVQQVIEKFPDKDPILVYNKCRMYYWWNCKTLESFEQDIKERLNSLEDINDLFL